MNGQMDNQDQHEGLVKIVFSLEQDEDGYPPVKTESLWAKPKADGSFELDNTPFYAQGISRKDIVAAEPISQACLPSRR
jgi:hypothetical protein